MSALSRQIAGSHYKNQKIQPLELAYMLGQTPAFCKVAKYSTRVKDDPVQQLNKALHCIELDEELKDYHYLYNKVGQGYAEVMIEGFTDCINLRKCLKALHAGDYPLAKTTMKGMITIAGGGHE